MLSLIRQTQLIRLPLFCAKKLQAALDKPKKKPPLIVTVAISAPYFLISAALSALQELEVLVFRLFQATDHRQFLWNSPIKVLMNFLRRAKWM
jgi:hypothetical protein